MKITSGPYEVFDSGSVISFGNEPVVFHLASDLKIGFAFFTDSENHNPRIEFDAANSAYLTLKLYNFNSSLGIGTNAPIQVGWLNERVLYVHFKVYTLTDPNVNELIHYTWYLGEQVNNG